MVLLGYEEGSKAYKLFDPCAGRVVVSRDVIFDKMAAWDWEDLGSGKLRAAAAATHSPLSTR
jgi:hypothetical protein